jgi:D-alanyl-D-alanine carboxypeptidase
MKTGADRFWIRTFLVITCFVLLISCAACGAAYKPFQAVLEGKAEAFHISAVNAAIISSGKMKWESRYGEFARSDSLYCIGSISKSFVAVLALILEEEGALCLDDEVGNFLPNFDVGNKKDVTLRDLLTMRSGIADYTDNFDTEDYFKEYSTQNLIREGLSNSVFSSQGEFLYSNTNILIAQQAIEQVTGKNCEELISKKILIPLALDNTFFAADKENIKERLVPGFSNTTARQQVDFTDTTTSWAGLACGMYSTAEDMAKWADALQNSDLISETSRSELFDFLPASNAMDYGLCVMRKKVDDNEVVMLQGNVPGYSCVIYLYNDDSMVILCNLSDYSGAGMSYAEDIADSFTRGNERIAELDI